MPLMSTFISYIAETQNDHAQRFQAGKHLKTLTDTESPFEIDDLKLTACFRKPWINPMTEASGRNGAIWIKRDCESA